MIGASEIVVRRPRARRQDDQNLRLARLICRSHDKEMMLDELAEVCARAGRDDPVKSRAEVFRQAPAMRNRPAAAGAIGLWRRWRVDARNGVNLVNGLRPVAVAIDLESPVRSRRRRMEDDLVVWIVRHGVGVGVHLRQRGIIAGRLVPRIGLPVIVGGHRPRFRRTNVERPEFGWDEWSLFGHAERSRRGQDSERLRDEVAWKFRE